MDWVVTSPEQWQFDAFDHTLSEVEQSLTAGADAVLLGRKTYQMWKDYWPNSDLDYASSINNTAKYVVSTTLDRVEWGDLGNISLINDPERGIRQLKAQPGTSVGVAGSVSLVQSLLQHDLLDELTLFVHPVVVGHGRRLFPEGDTTRFRLTGSDTTPTGVAILTYQPRHDPREQA
jgi:dihydrofolate reductase